MGQRIPGGAQPMPQPGQGGGGGAAELASNISNGLEAISQMVGSQFGEEAGNAIMQLQQQFQQIMLEIGKQGQQPAPGDQAGAAQGAVPAGPQIQQ